MSSLVSYAGPDEYCYGNDADVWYQLLRFRYWFRMEYGVKCKINDVGTIISVFFSDDSGFIDFQFVKEYFRIRKVQALYDYDADRFDIHFSVYKKRLGGYWKHCTVTYTAFPDNTADGLSVDFFKRSRKYAEFRDKIIRLLRPEYRWRVTVVN